MVRLIPGERVGARSDRAFALLAVAAEFRAGNSVGLGLGAAAGELDLNRLSLGRMRHWIPPGRLQHTPSRAGRMSQMDYAITLFQTRVNP